MALTINTNISSLVAQQNLSKATNSLNSAIERMTTGYKINKASDNAAGYSIAKNWEVKLSSLDVAADNAATASDMLATMEDNCNLIASHLQRVKDLTEQAANGTYGDTSRTAIASEITARLDEIDRIAANCEFNDIHLLNGDNKTAGITFQVGLDGTGNSRITVDKDVFKEADSVSLLSTVGATKAAIATACSGSSAADQLTKLNTAINAISSRITAIGAAGNRIDSAIESISVQSENITSSLSTLRDADIASESSKYIQAQILQQAASTLLSTANQTPSIALNLL
jgi:flagellin